MKAVVVAARRPIDVAREVEALTARGVHWFAIAPVDDGGMLDQERLGAARYAAGLHSKVELELRRPLAAAVK